MPRFTLTPDQEVVFLELIARFIAERGVSAAEGVLTAILATNTELMALLRPRLLALHAEREAELANVATTATQRTAQLTDTIAAIDSLAALL